MSEAHFSIVVVGAMNPRIHHPAVYELMGAITPEQAKIAQETTGLVCTDDQSRFTGADVEVGCAPESWVAIVNEERFVPSLLSVTGKVWTALGYTPISSFGFNIQLPGPKLDGVGQHFLDLAKRLPLGFDDLGDGGAAFTGWGLSPVETTLGRNVVRKHRIHIAPHASSGMVLTSQNFHYDLSSFVGKFELGEAIRHRFDKDLAEAKTQLARTSKALEGAR